jgi:hypothetical protein
MPYKSTIALMLSTLLVGILFTACYIEREKDCTCKSFKGETLISTTEIIIEDISCEDYNSIMTSDGVEIRIECTEQE